MNDGPFIQIAIPDEARQAVQAWIGRSRIVLPEGGEVTFTDCPSFSPHAPMLAMFQGQFNYDYRQQLFVVVVWQDKEWHVRRVNELFVAALSGELKQVMKTWPHYENAGE